MVVIDGIELQGSGFIGVAIGGEKISASRPNGSRIVLTVHPADYGYGTPHARVMACISLLGHAVREVLRYETALRKSESSTLAERMVSAYKEEEGN